MAMYNVKMLLTIQIKRASRRAGWKWYQYYSVRGYGAPGVNEFVCPYSGMVAKTINQEEAASVRRYWAACAATSREVLEWLELLPTHQYTRELNRFLLRLVVVTTRQREIKKYKESHPIEDSKPWRELLSTTSSIPQLDGLSSRQAKPTIELRSVGKHYVRIAR
jgi:hypothetical protein